MDIQIKAVFVIITPEGMRQKKDGGDTVRKQCLTQRLQTVPPRGLALLAPLERHDRSYRITKHKQREAQFLLIQCTVQHTGSMERGSADLS